MSLRLPLALTAVALATTFAVTPAASAACRCRPRAHERTIARNAVAAVLLYVRDHGDDRDELLIGCSVRSGRRRSITRAASGFSGGTWIDAARLNGTRVAVLEHFADAKSGVDEVSLRSDDAVQRVRVGGVPAAGHIVAFAAGPRGEVAWTADAELRLWTPTAKAAGDTRVLDQGVALTRPRFVGPHRLTWRHGERPMARTLPLLPGACLPDSATGTAEVDFAYGDGRTYACLRGGAQPLGVGPAGLVDEPWRPLHLSVAPPYLALVEGTDLVRIDLRDGARLTVPAGVALMPVVTPSEALAWLHPAGSDVEVWVADGAGARAIANIAHPLRQPTLVRDGETIAWNGGAGYTFAGPPAT
jgi:hypothetical protein